MSRAFVREDQEQQWLHEVEGTVSALETYLTRENNGIRVSEKHSMTDKKTGADIHVMSNGLSYARDGDGKWYVV